MEKVKLSQILKEGKTTIEVRVLSEKDTKLMAFIAATEKKQAEMEKLKEISQEDLMRVIQL
jgi:hypothetical protein